MHGARRHQVSTAVPAQVHTHDYANAGHPPPLLITPDGDARYLIADHSVLLGVDPHAARPSGQQALTGGSTILLYADGLIERPGEHLDTGLECCASMAPPWPARTFPPSSHSSWRASPGTAVTT